LIIFKELFKQRGGLQVYKDPLNTSWGQLTISATCGGGQKASAWAQSANTCERRYR